MKDFRYFSMSLPEISHKFNPFKAQSPSEVKDLIICSTDWSEPFYKKVAESVLLDVIKSLKEVSLSNIIKHIPDDDRLLGLKSDLEIMIFP